MPMVTPHPKRGKKVSSRRFDGLGSGPPKRVEAGTTAPALIAQYSRDEKEEAFEIEFSRFGRSLKRSAIRAVTAPAQERRAAGHEVKMLAGGLPHEANFPIKSLVLNGDIELPCLQQGLQYHTGAGLAAFREEMCRLLGPYHNREGLPIDRLCGSTGCTDALAKTVELLTEVGDDIFVEDLTWPGFLSITKARNRNIIPLAFDTELGLDPISLDQALAKRKNKQKQALLYTVPSGHNPTGVTVPEERKRQIYAVCQQHNVIILEDDPYYFLAMGEKTSNPLPVSYLSMDTDDRVIRLDSFAKIFAPGLRLGTVIAPPAFIQKFTIANEQSSQFPCGLAQTVAIALLREWGQKGFDAHLTNLQTDYLRRRNLLVDALNKESAAIRQNNLLEFTIPSHGMFLFVKQSAFPNADDLVKRLTQADVAVVPGSCFMAIPYDDDQDLSSTLRQSGSIGGDGKHDDHPEDSCPFFRLTFAAASDEHLTQAASIIVHTIADVPLPPATTPP